MSILYKQPNDLKQRNQICVYLLNRGESFNIKILFIPDEERRVFQTINNNQ